MVYIKDKNINDIPEDTDEGPLIPNSQYRSLSHSTLLFFCEIVQTLFIFIIFTETSLQENKVPYF